MGDQKCIEIQGRKMLKKCDCMEEGEMTECVGNKIECNCAERSLKMSQPILMQSFEDEFEML